MDAKQLEFLRSQDWDDIAAKVLVSAIFWARKYGWFPGKPMPQNMTPEIVAQDVIADFWRQNRPYNPKWNLVTQLRNVAKSKISNLYGRMEAKTTESFADPELKRPVQDQEDQRRTDVIVEMRDDFDRAIELLSEHPKVKKSPDLQLVVIAMGCRFFEVPDLARETKLPTERIHQLKRELRDIYPTIAQQLKNDRGGAQ
jgi:hypothetical protein